MAKLFHHLLIPRSEVESLAQNAKLADRLFYARKKPEQHPEERNALEPKPHSRNSPNPKAAIVQIDNSKIQPAAWRKKEIGVNNVAGIPFDISFLLTK